MTTASRPQIALNYTILIICSAIAVYPLVGVLLASLYPSGPRSAPSGFGLPPSFEIHNYATAWRQGQFSSYFATSAIVAAGVVPASLILSILGGFAFGTMRFRGSKVLFYLFILGLIIPSEAIIVSLYYDIRAVHLIDTYWALILVEVAGEVAFGVFWMRAAFLSAPRSLLEAARIDGASVPQTFVQVMVPLARPALATLAIFNFLWAWNEFMFALFILTSTSTKPLTVAVQQLQGRFDQDPTGLMAGLCIATLPVIGVYLIFQRHLVRAITAGVGK
jgi:raffinose/stachyose/melibiose transport system permease protein